jgi:hypothetical protein
MLIHIIGMLCVFSGQLQTCLGQYLVKNEPFVSVCKNLAASIEKANAERNDKMIGECLTGKCVQQVDSDGAPARFDYKFYFKVGNDLCTPNSYVSWHVRNPLNGLHNCAELCQSADGAVWFVSDDLVPRKVYSPKGAGAGSPRAGANDAAPAEASLSGMYVHLTCVALLAICFFLG